MVCAAPGRAARTAAFLCAATPLSGARALSLAGVSPAELPELLGAAAVVRDRCWGRTVTYSPKAFLPLSNLCRNRCDYCSFRRSPRDPGAWTMSPEAVCKTLDEARNTGCSEALFCLGDKPEGPFSSYRDALAGWGFADTVGYIRWASQQALERGLLPHTNAGILSRDDMQRLRPVSASLGLMLETVSARLSGRGMPHHRAPDKHPAKRIAMTRAAGALHIAFTSGILVGIGETPRERVQSLLAIRAMHREHGHIQEVIVQPFRRKAGSPMANASEVEDWEVAHAIALARLILPEEISIQAPPNLNPGTTSLLLQAGINDFGGISPLTPDYINPGHPWPHVEALRRRCAALGFALRPRLSIYPRHATTTFLDPRMLAHVRQAERRWPS